jgi:hypothetical protein
MRVRATAKCFIDNQVRDTGEVFEYNGPHNANVELVDGGSWESESTVAVMEAPKRKPGRPKMTKDTDGA